MNKRIKNWSLAVLGIFIAGLILTSVSESAMRGVYGFAAVAANNRWHNIKDVSIGDDITEGAMIVAPCMYDGTNCDRLRGDTTNGLDVDVTRVGGTVSIAGGVTPADGTTNPTTALNTQSLNSLFNGSTWDRWLESTHGDNLTTASGGNVASFLYGFDGSAWDRIRGDATNGLDVKITNASAIGGTVNQTTLLDGVATTQFSLNTDLTTVLCEHSWTTVLTGAPTGVTVTIEGSLDGVDWFTMDTNTSTSSAMRHFVDTCIVQIRANLSVLAGGTSPTVTIKSVSK